MFWSRCWQYDFYTTDHPFDNTRLPTKHWPPSGRRPQPWGDSRASCWGHEQYFPRRSRGLSIKGWCRFRRLTKNHYYCFWLNVKKFPLFSGADSGSAPCTPTPTPFSPSPAQVDFTFPISLHLQCNSHCDDFKEKSLLSTKEMLQHSILAEQLAAGISRLKVVVSIKFKTWDLFYKANIDHECVFCLVVNVN